jgi:hypothetical protein
MVALVFDGILAGSGIDRGIVGFPGLRRLGVVTFARYGRVADLGNGRVLYPLLAIVGALAELTVLVLTWLGQAPRELYASVGTAFVASVVNLALTVRAAPAMLAIGRTPDDEDLLRPLRDRFVSYSYARLVFICVKFGAICWAMARLAVRS